MAEIAEKGNSRNFENWFHITSLIGKIFVFLSMISYVFGFLTANIYFGQFGISTISFFKANYFLTGALMVILLCFPSFIVFGIFKIMKDDSLESEDRKKVYLILIGTSILIGFLASFDFIKIINLSMSLGILMVFAIPIITMVNSIYIFKSYFNFINNAEKEKTNPYFSTQGLIGIGITTFFLLASIPMFIIAFAENVYPEIPSFIGGIKSAKVQVFLNSDSETKNAFNNYGFKQKNDGSWDCKLITSTDSEYLFANAIDANGILSVRRQDIKAIKYNTEFPLNK